MARSLGVNKVVLCLVLVLLVCIVEQADAIAVKPIPPGGHVSSSRDKNLVLLKSGWRIIDYDKQFERGKPIPPVDDKHVRPESIILVLVASLRETRLKDTLLSMMTNAKYPERVHFAIVQQNAPEDEDIVEEYCRAMGHPVTLNPETKKPNEPGCPHVENIRVLRMLATEARGPAYARALGNKLVDFEHDDFCMQIDAHTKVVKDWDVLILEDWAKADNEFGILTTYPTNVNDLGKNTGHHWEMPHLCCAGGQRGVMVNCQAKAAANLERPLLAPLWAAGLSFSKCHAEKVAPNDPNLKGVFAGEEYARGVRLWTHGYDFYSNSRPWVGTYYGGEKGAKSYSWKSDALSKSHDRMATLVGVPGSDQSPAAIKALEPYGLGNKRSIEQYIEFTGINPRTGDTKNPICAVVFVPWNNDNSQESPHIAEDQPPRSIRGANDAATEYKDVSKVSTAVLHPRGKIILCILLLVVAVFSSALLISRSRVCKKPARKD